MKFKEKKQAQLLRRKGASYGEILKKINVSKGTLSIWLKNIKLTKIQKKRLFITLRQQSAYRGAKKKQLMKKELTEKIVSQSKKEMRHLHKKHLFTAGLMLYWAEGDKSDDQEIVKFTNSDERLIKIIMLWFRKYCKVREERFRIGLHIHNLHTTKDVEKYWSKITKIPLSQFNKTYIKKTSLGQRKNILYNGTCAVKICDKNLFRKIKGWKLGYLEIFNKML